MSMKVSISIKEQDLEFIDRCSDDAASSRSAVVQRAIALLRDAELEKEYTEAFAEWDASEDAALWDSTSGDGID